MKQHIIVGLLTIFVLAPVVEVFSASINTGRFLTLEQQEELGVPRQAPSTTAVFPFAPNNTTFGLTFRLWITNLTNTAVNLQFSTTCQGTVTTLFTVAAFAIAAFSPTDIVAPPEQFCQVMVSAPGPAGIFTFAAVLEILMGTTSVDFLPPTFYFTTGGG